VAPELKAADLLQVETNNDTLVDGNERLARAATEMHLDLHYALLR
jgi:prophage maintenance system killer protein